LIQAYDLGILGDSMGTFAKITQEDIALKVSEFYNRDLGWANSFQIS